MPCALFYQNSLGKSIFSIRVSRKFVFLSCLIGISLFNANSVYPDQTSHSAVSDLDLTLFANVPFHWTLGLNGLNILLDNQTDLFKFEDKYSKDLNCTNI